MRRGKRRFSRSIWLIGLLCVLWLAACAEKTTGGGSNDADDDDDASPTGVGEYSVHLNMVAVTIGDVAEAQPLTVYDAAGEAAEIEAVRLSDFVAGIAEFAADAPDFSYEIVDGLENSVLAGGGALVAYEELASAAFYENPDGDNLCLGWLEAGREAQSLCGMAGGALIGHPVDGAIDFQSVQWVDERTGDQPTHLGEEAALRGVVTVGAGVMVYGSYLKTFIQQGGYGVKVFADAGATVDDQGYDGGLYAEVVTYQGDEVFVQGRITLHDGMIEFVPKSAYHLAVLSTNNAVESPVALTIDQAVADPYRYAGALVRFADLEMADVNPDDPTTDWPGYGNKSKEIRVRHTGGGAKIGMPIYEGTGIPGSYKPDAGFTAAGAFNIEGDGFNFYPRSIEDINPTDQRLAGQVRVSIVGEDRTALVDLADLPASLQRLSAEGEPEPVVSLGAAARAAGLLRNWSALSYKPAAYDGRKPFESLEYRELIYGVLYQGAPSSQEEPDPLVNSFFWEGMDLSEIYYLNGVTEVLAYRPVEPPPEGDAEHGEGLTLQIDGVRYAINFDTLPHTTYNGDTAIAFDEFISEEVMNLYTMEGSFTTDQIRLLYDYRLVSYDGEQEDIVRFGDLASGYVVLADPPYAVFPELGSGPLVEDVYLIDMLRYIQVDDGSGGDPIVVYLQDCPTEDADIGDGEMAPVVFYRSVLEAAGIDLSQGMYLYDFALVASDDFVSNWTYGHNHLVNMFVNPATNRGYTTDPDLSAYGGRVSTKAVYEIRMTDVPQEAPSIQVDVNGQALWGADANSCEGCHFKEGALNLPVDCFSCHAAP